MAKAALPLQICRAQVKSVMDGDTILAALLHTPPGSMITVTSVDRIRLSGINSRKKDSESGKAAKELLSKLLEQHAATLVVTWVKREKYGRLLGTLWAEMPGLAEPLDWNKSINRQLLSSGLYDAYDGIGLHKEMISASATSVTNLDTNAVFSTHLAYQEAFNALKDNAVSVLKTLREQLFKQPPPRVLIEVRGGVAEYTVLEGNVTVELVDYDEQETAWKEPIHEAEA